MAETARSYPLGNQLDIQQIVREAQKRWLRPAEICEILRNYKNFRIAPEPVHRPGSGSLFLFDRKVLRYFRKDGHNWRKKKDGKTVKEAHERLKAGSIEVLHCYYAHGEENEQFQRRSYWMLEEELSHIVLVHYRDVKGGRTNSNRIRESDEIGVNTPNYEMETSVSSNFHANNYQVPAHTVDTVSMISAQASEYEDAESDYNHQASSRFHSFLEVQQPAMEKTDAAGPSNLHDPASFSNNYQRKLPTVPGLDAISLGQVDKHKNSNGNGLVYEPEKHVDLPSWEDLQNYTPGIASMPFQQPFFSHVDKVEGQVLTNSFGERRDFGDHVLLQEGWQNFEGDSSHMLRSAVDHMLPSDLAYNLVTRFHEREFENGGFTDTFLSHIQDNDLSVQNDLQTKVSNVECTVTLDGKSMYSSPMKQHLLDGHLGKGSLKKLDSFDRWMTKELGDVNEPRVQSSSGAYWDTMESENGVADSNIPSQAHLDSYMLSPSLSQDQFFSIIDFSPNWVYVGLEDKVLVTGRFLKSQEEVENCKWSCMFGEIEVPAEVVAEGVLRCHTPLREAGRVPFYVTCSNRVACSEVREFEYRLSNIQDSNMTDNHKKNSPENFHLRFGNLLCISSVIPPNYESIDPAEISQLSSQIGSLLKEDGDELDQMLKFTSGEAYSAEKAKDQLLQLLLKEKLHAWLLQKVAEGGKGPSVLDEGGQGVLHFAAALGYDWALKPTIVAGASVDFRDVNGWTALHWAASCGRELTVACLLHLGAAPGALTDPTPQNPKGRTPADLASANGHKGIAGYLAESALIAQLNSLNLDKQSSDAAEISGEKVVQSGSECSTIQVADGDLPCGLSMKDSLAAVRNATQTAALIHQVFRVQSFQKKRLKEYSDNKFRMSDERVLSLLAVKSHKLGQYDEPVQAAAIRIQNKFRSWKGRKEFLIIRQRIVKIQAHVRGHQVRKNYRKIIWSVGILEKVILRWRRKGSGLRGFKSEALTEGPSTQDASRKEDDYDFFREGRKQTEERSQIALARVKSMLQYPEARDQYSRLRNVATEIQKNKETYNANSTAEFDDLIDLEPLDNDPFMTHAS